MIESKSEQPGAFPQKLLVRGVHGLRADVDAATGSSDSAPSPHDYFDAALASCKALTAIWFAKHNQLPLERVESQVDRDAAQERKGIYKLRVKLALFGPLSEEQRQRIYAAVEKCPIHKLMTTSDVIVATEPLVPEGA